MSAPPPFGLNVMDPLLEVGGGQDYDLPLTRRSLEFMKQVGVPAIEYSHALHWNDQELVAVHAMTAELGLYPWSLHCWCGGDIMVEANAQETLRHLRQGVKAALALKVGVIVHHAWGSTLQGQGLEVLETEANLLAAAWQPGVRFALENVGSRAQWEYTLKLVDVLGPKIAGCNVDTGHANLAPNLTPDQAIRLAGERLITTHLQDNHGQRDDHLPPFEGTVDWVAVATALREVEYQGCLMIEQTDMPSADRRHADFPDEIRRGVAAGQRLAEMVWG